MAESQPELLARHYTEAGLMEKAVDFWGKAGQRSLARSAVVEACEQLNRALDLLATLPQTSASRRQQLKLQIALANALMQVKGYAAPEPKAARACSWNELKRSASHLRTRYCCLHFCGGCGAQTSLSSMARL
jgi:predicted ATPase